MNDELCLQDVKKRFPCGDEWLDVLCGVDLQLSRGDIASIVGDSGCGKSTLLHVIGGMETPTSGRVLLDQQSVYDQSSEARSLWRNRQVGLVFQFHHLLPEFTAVENLMMPLLIRKHPKDDARHRAVAMLDEMALSRRAQARPAQLSGGEQQRIAIGRALMGEPSLLLMDEPTGNLDPAVGERVMDMVLNMVSQRKIFLLLVTHNPGLAKSCPVQLTMRGGRLYREA